MRRAICFVPRRRLGAIAVLMLLCAPSVLRAAPIVLRVFNLGQTQAYVVQRNSNTVETQSTTHAGVFSELVDAARGDRITLLPIDDLSPPIPPVFLAADVRGPACAHLEWKASSDPAVVGYVISYGVLSVENGGITEYQYSVEVGPIAGYDVCALAGNTYYFAVQAVNYAGQLSAFSPEIVVRMTTTAVFISRFDARAGRSAVQLSWQTETDEPVSGYRIYRREPGASEQSIVDAPLPAAARSYVDRDVSAAATYTYTLAAIREDGSEVRSAPASVTMPAFRLALSPNQPNPFRDSTRIPFTLDRESIVSLRIFDVKGALVATLFEGVLPEGAHEMSWGGHDNAGHSVASGTYFYTLSAGKRLASRKMLLVR